VSHVRKGARAKRIRQAAADARIEAAKTDWLAMLQAAATEAAGK
jgi:hypothetical protein